MPTADIKTENIINEIKLELKEKYPEFCGIYLFGSRARGNFQEDSDYDLAIIFDREIDWKFKDKIRKEIAQYMVRNDVIIDNPIYTKNNIDHPQTCFQEIIKNEGIFYGC